MYRRCASLAAISNRIKQYKNRYNFVDVWESERSLPGGACERRLCIRRQERDNRVVCGGEKLESLADQSVVGLECSGNVGSTRDGWQLEDNHSSLIKKVVVVIWDDVIKIGTHVSIKRQKDTGGMLRARGMVLQERGSLLAGPRVPQSVVKLF